MHGGGSCAVAGFLYKGDFMAEYKYVPMWTTDNTPPASYITSAGYLLYTNPNPRYIVSKLVAYVTQSSQQGSVLTDIDDVLIAGYFHENTWLTLVIASKKMLSILSSYERVDEYLYRADISGYWDYSAFYQDNTPNIYNNSFVYHTTSYAYWGVTLEDCIKADSLNDALEKLYAIYGPSSSDPYAGGGMSTPGGGHGDFDSMTDSVNTPSYDPVELLNRGFANRGFVKVYLPTQAQLLSLHNYLWSSNIDNTLKKMYASPIDCIISLNMLPLSITGTNTSNILIGNVDTEIASVQVADNQFITLDCGTISISEYFGSYLDYSPATKLQIYLPYIGLKDLDVDDFMNGEIGLKYYIDIVSGSCVAMISQTNLSSNDVRPALAGGAGVLYQFAGNVAFNVPISAQNFAQIYAATAGAMVSGAGMLAGAVTGGLSAPVALTGIAATSLNVATSKPTISRGGSIPSTCGYLGTQKPYLILTRPRQCLPEDQNLFIGYPAYITVTVGNVSGYNEFEIVHLENVPATDSEKAEIENLLRNGVIL